MRTIALILILLAAPRAGSCQPTPPQNTVFIPTFITGYDSYTAGTAFVCESPNGEKSLLLTAHHLLGSAGGFPTELNWDQLNRTIKMTVGLSMDDSSTHVFSKRAILIQGARALDKAGFAEDLAAFELAPDKARPTLKLATQSPKVGDKVWLLGRLPGSSKLELVLGTVRSSTPKELRYEFDRGGIKLTGTSGAPVLNASGDVVAVNIGGGQREGKVVGIGNPLPSITALLTKALAK